MAWTDFGSVGVGRRAILTQIDRKRQAPGHPGVDPVFFGFERLALKYVLRVFERYALYSTGGITGAHHSAVAISVLLYMLKRRAP